MKFLKTISFTCLTLALLVVAQTGNAAPADSKRVSRAEKVNLVVPFNVSNTIYTAKKYAVASPVDGWITGLYFTYEGPNAVTSGTSANIVAKIGGVSLTTISITVPSPTSVLAGISSTVNSPKDVSTTGDVTKGQVIELGATGSPLMTGTTGGEGRMVIEVTPNYTPARFRQ